jgi:type II secretory pathway predicted ATPase ExeA
MSDEIDHLHASTRSYLEESDEVRIRRIRTDRWITYDRAEAALGTLHDVLQFPKRTRMPNLALVGPTNNGKTMIIEKFRRAYPVVEANRTPEGTAIVPVIKVQMSPGPDERRFFGAILDAINFPYLPTESVAKRQDSAMRLMRSSRVDLLIIDEIHNLLSGSRLQQRRLLNLLRWLGNELQIPLVAVGTQDALHAIQSDDQLANRFTPIGLPPWRDGETFRKLLSTLEAVLPLKRASNLQRADLAGQILGASEGILGEIIALVTTAAVAAIRGGDECITPKLLETCGFVAPSKRRRVAG